MSSDWDTVSHRTQEGTHILPAAADDTLLSKLALFSKQQVILNMYQAKISVAA